MVILRLFRRAVLRKGSLTLDLVRLQAPCVLFYGWCTRPNGEGLTWLSNNQAAIFWRLNICGGSVCIIIMTMVTSEYVKGNNREAFIVGTLHVIYRVWTTGLANPNDQIRMRHLNTDITISLWCLKSGTCADMLPLIKKWKTKRIWTVNWYSCF